MWDTRVLDLIVFFFKQKTADAMRISDWSSDVCSSDLIPARPCFLPKWKVSNLRFSFSRIRRSRTAKSGDGMALRCRHGANGRMMMTSRHIRRSEEHTSELQSLMRISYAVFCLKKKNNTTHPLPTAELPSLSSSQQESSYILRRTN